VTGIAPGGKAGVEVTTDKARHSAGTVILAAGPGMPGLLELARIDLPLTVAKEHVGYFLPADPARFELGRFPIFIMHLPGHLSASGFPLHRDRGVKLMAERKIARRGHDDHEPESDHIEMLSEHAVRLLPGLQRRPAEVATCTYTLTADQDFVIDRSSEHPNIIVVSACSGHGFKFAALMGEEVASLAAEEARSAMLEPFRIDRPSLRRDRQDR
jgi:sarcosine oxidase